MPSKIVKNKDHITIESDFPFAFWSLPGSSKWQGIVQDNTQIETAISEIVEGFLVCPFNKESGLRIIRPDTKITMLDDFDIVNSNASKSEIPKETSKEEYLTQCTLLIDKIKNGESAKVVLSRVKKKACGLDAKTLFLRLLDKYPQAMVFMYSFGDEVWIGASPETLLKVENGDFMTMALAGSKGVNEQREWTEKEMKEQAYVEVYIENILKNNNISFHKIGPKDISAGPVNHLLTEFKGKLEKSDFSPLLNELHPTPAVCGIPLQEANNIINHLELHNRRDYTGFIGPIYSDKAHMFVNLRSAMLVNQDLFLYLGGGITEGSIPEEEWNETELKADTLLSIL